MPAVRAKSPSKSGHISAYNMVVVVVLLLLVLLLALLVLMLPRGSLGALLGLV